MRRKQLPVYLSDAAMRDIWRANHESRWRGTDGTVILLGRRTQRRILVLLAITEADAPAVRRAKERAARKARLVVVGQSRAVTENLLRTTTRAINDRYATTFITPPVGHVFLVRHRLGPRGTFTAASFDGDAVTQHRVHLLITRH